MSHVYTDSSFTKWFKLHVIYMNFPQNVCLGIVVFCSLVQLLDSCQQAYLFLRDDLLKLLCTNHSFPRIQDTCFALMPIVKESLKNLYFSIYNFDKCFCVNFGKTSVIQAPDTEVLMVVRRSECLFLTGSWFTINENCASKFSCDSTIFCTAY